MRPALVILVVAATPASLVLGQQRDLTFKERVEAQAAIERVEYAHQIGATRRFEDAVPRSVLEKKVETYLRQSMLLDRRWHTPITAETLRRETGRILSRTRSPERLREVFAALGNDPVLIQECLVRPVLADRLARSFHAGEARSEDAAAPGPGEVADRRPETWDAWWARVGPTIDGRSLRTAADPEVSLTIPGPRRDVPLDERALTGAAPECQDDTWRSTLADVPMVFTTSKVWTGSRLFVWQGFRRNATPEGWLYDPVIDAWSRVSSVGAPLQQREYETAVWVGGRVVVWGGRTPNSSGFVDGLNTGARYDPLTDTWAPVTTTGAPEGRAFHLGAAVGGTMIILWGNHQGQLPTTAGRYDPVADTWAPMNLIDAPFARTGYASVSSDTELVIWGGLGDAAHPGSTNTGGRYNPATDTWSSMSVAGAPSKRDTPSAIWTGTRVLIWGGTEDGYFANGGLYNPSTDTWQPTGTTGAPIGRSAHNAVWTGTEMIVWGGLGVGATYRSDGGRYNPATGVWAPLSNLNAPAARGQSIAAWTGSRMLVWGGMADSVRFNTGGRYDPDSNTWTPTSVGTVPEARVAQAVWTGTRLIVWGGQTQSAPYSNDGARYDPMLDAWTPTTMAGAPQARRGHSLLWAGDRMIVWGGLGSTTLDSGGRYDPVADAWSSTSVTNAPAARAAHVSTWTGTTMIVWGGYSNPLNQQNLNTGGRYDPLADSWVPMSTSGAPTGTGATVWWKQRMWVMGVFTGGRYDPVMDAWTAPGGVGGAGFSVEVSGDWLLFWGGQFNGTNVQTGTASNAVTGAVINISTAGAPSPRNNHNAVWTGTDLIVWGGQDANGLRGDGARWNMQTNSWTALDPVDAPSPRIGSSAVWTGEEMLVWGGSGGGGDLLNTGGGYRLSPDLDEDGYRLCGGDCDDAQPGIHPGAPDVCDAIDNDCDLIVDEGVDADGDGRFTCGGDCDDTNAGVWAAPGTVSGLVVTSATPLDLSWDSEAVVSGPSTGYSVVSGTTSVFGGVDFTAASCLGTTPSAQFEDGRGDPGSGAFYWYLVRPLNSCGVGSYGTAQRDSQIAACP